MFLAPVDVPVLLKNCKQADAKIRNWNVVEWLATLNTYPEVGTLLYKGFPRFMVILVNQVWHYNCFHWKQL